MSAPLLGPALAGVAATFAMSAWMRAFEGAASARPLGHLPPRRIGDRILAAVGAEAVSPKQRKIFATLGHYGYGGLMGAVFPKLRQGHLVQSAPAFGVGVRAASYVGWLPAIGLHSSPRHMNLQRNISLFVGHIVWGKTFAALTSIART